MWARRSASPPSRRELLFGSFFKRAAGSGADAASATGIQEKLASGDAGTDPTEAMTPPAPGVPASVPDGPGRALLESLVGPSAGASSRTHRPQPRRPQVLPLLRPPGAIDEASFLEGCTRCNDCSSACPHGAIVPAPARYRQAAGTPMIDPQQNPCHLCSDTPCISACKAGVLQPGVPFLMGRASIQTQSCLAYQGNFCSSCRERCPVPGAVRVENGRPIIVEELCTGCGFCQYVCPAPQNAILVLPNLARAPRLPVTEISASQESSA